MQVDCNPITLYNVLSNSLIRDHVISYIYPDHVILRMLNRDFCNIIPLNHVTRIINYLRFGGTNIQALNELYEHEVEYVIDYFRQRRDYAVLSIMCLKFQLKSQIIVRLLREFDVEGFRWSLKHMSDVKDIVRQECVATGMSAVTVELTVITEIMQRKLGASSHKMLKRLFVADFVYIMLKLNLTDWMIEFMKNHSVWRVISDHGLWYYVTRDMWNILPALSTIEWWSWYTSTPYKSGLLVMLMHHDVWAPSLCYVDLFNQPYNILVHFLKYLRTNKQRNMVVAKLAEHEIKPAYIQMIYYPEYDYDYISTCLVSPRNNMSVGAWIIHNHMHQIFMGGVDLSNVTEDKFMLKEMYPLVFRYNMLEYLYIMVHIDGGRNIDESVIDNLSGYDRDRLRGFIECINKYCGGSTIAPGTKSITLL